MIVPIGSDSCPIAPPKPAPPPQPLAKAPASAPDSVCPVAPQSTAASAIVDRNTTGGLKGAAMANPMSWFPQGPLPAKASVTDPNGYRYSSDRFGRPQTARADLVKNHAPSQTRDSVARSEQRAAGGADRLATDQGGHSIGNQFHGRNDVWSIARWRTSGARRSKKAVASPRKREAFTASDAAADGLRIEILGERGRRKVTGDEQRAERRRLRVARRNDEGRIHVERARSRIDRPRRGRKGRGSRRRGRRRHQHLSAYRQDGGTVGAHTLHATGGAAGGWAGAAAGAELGAVPGAIVGGSPAAWWAESPDRPRGKDVVKFGEDMAGDASHAASKAVDLGKPAVDSAKSAGSKVLSWVGL